MPTIKYRPQNSQLPSSSRRFLSSKTVDCWVVKWFVCIVSVSFCRAFPIRVGHGEIVFKQVEGLGPAFCDASKNPPIQHGA